MILIRDNVKDGYVFFVRGRRFILGEKDGSLSVRFLNLEIDSDATAGLHEAALMLAGACGGSISSIGYPEEILVTGFQGTAAEAIAKIEQSAQDSLREFVLHCQFPLNALLRTLQSCGMSRKDLADAANLSRARISAMLSDPYCCAVSETMFRLRNFVMRKFPVLSSLLDAADGFCRRRLGEMYNREK